MLVQIVPATLYAFLIVLSRVGATLMLAPGIGENSVSPRIRMALALLVSLLLFSVVRADIPPMPAQPLMLAPLIFGEVLIGLLLGGIGRLALSALQVAGTVMAFQSGLGFGQFFDPTQSGQSALLASLLGFVGLVLIFVTNLHLLMLRALADSYRLFPVGALPPMGDFAHMATLLVAGAFRIGIQIAAPFIVYGLVFTVAIGALNRLMPQAQISFISMPAQILGALVILLGSIGIGMTWFLNYYQSSLTPFLVR